jgi:hypothetical protein
MVALLADFGGEIKCVELPTRDPERVKPNENSKRAIFVGWIAHNAAPLAIGSITGSSSRHVRRWAPLLQAVANGWHVADSGHAVSEDRLMIGHRE